MTNKALAAIREARAQTMSAGICPWVNKEDIPSFEAWLALFVEGRIAEDRAVRAHEPVAFIEMLKRDLDIMEFGTDRNVLETAINEIGRLHCQILELEKLCDATYVAMGADAYNHACDEMEAWQEKRRVRGQEAGTTGSLCDGMAWLYEHIEHLEAAPQPVNVTDKPESPACVSNRAWIEHAYPLQQVEIRLQGTRHSNKDAIMSLLETVVARLKAGDSSGQDHDDDFGYTFDYVAASSGPSFFDECPCNFS